MDEHSGFAAQSEPTTPQDRQAFLDQVLGEIGEIIEEHEDDGLSLRNSLPKLAEFVFDSQRGTLVSHALNGACRVTIYLSGFHDGFRMVPGGVAEITGTCKDNRRRQVCTHTLAALAALRDALLNRAHPLRERLFQLGNAEAWRSALSLVDKFLANPSAARHSATAAAPSEPATRVVWRVEFGIDNSKTPSVDLTVEPYEQKRNKSGNWSKGRKLTWDALAHVDKELLGEAERRLIIKFKEKANPYDYYYGYGYGRSPKEPLPAFDVLSELAGSQSVYLSDSPHIPAEVVWGEFGAVIDESPAGWQILPAFDGAVRYGETIWSKNGSQLEKPIWIDRSGNRIVLSKAPASVVTLVAHLSQLKEPIPPEGQAAILERLTLLQRTIPVRLPASLSAGTEPADPWIFLRLTPGQAGGASAEMLAIPVAGGAAYVPGAGPAAISQLKDGKQYQFERQLAAERARAGELVEELHLAPFAGGRSFHWHLPERDDVLDLLARIADAAIPDLVVQWPEGTKTSVSSVIQPAALRVQITQQQDWFGLSGKVDIDGQEVELARILAAMRRGERYVEVAPQQFVRLAKSLRQSLEAIDDSVYETKKGKLELDITAAPILDQLCDPSVALKLCRGWSESLRKLRSAQELQPEPPATLQANLRDYQLEGYRWLRRLAEWGMGGCLADDMGLGKTVQALAVLIDRRDEGPALVIAPTSVGFNWVREAERFAPTLRPVLYHESDRADVLQNLGAGDVLIVSYGLLLRDVEKLAKIPWGTLVLDEAQKIKNSVTKTAQAVRQIEARWRLALTGTPLENHLGELWSIFRAICPGLFGSWDRFRAKFAEPIERQKDPARRRALSRLIRPFILRRTKGEVLEELPQRTELIRTAELTPAEQQRYNAARLAAIADLAGAGEGKPGGPEDHRFEVLAALTRLRQLACHPRLVDADWPGDSAKLELFMEIALELREGGHRALVFSQFVQHLGLIRAALDAAGISYQYLDGQTPASERRERVDAFQRGEGELFLISLKAGGTGLNLTAADYVIHMDPWWNPAVEDQATDRAHRIGQTRPVTVYRLVTKGTIEEQILALHAGKRSLVADVLEGTDQAGKLGTKELVALIRGESAAEESAADAVAADKVVELSASR